MKISRKNLRKIILKEKNRPLAELGDPAMRGTWQDDDDDPSGSDPRRSNAPPHKDSNWSEFAKALDIGVLDLDEIAYDLGFADFDDMDISISPRALANRDAESFITAAQNNSLRAEDMYGEEILDAAGGGHY